MAKTIRAAPRKKPKQERSTAMFEALLEAAARVFVKEGYAKATTNRIATAAGVSVGSLYQYFPSKDAIAVELLRRYRDGLVTLITARLSHATADNFPDIIHALLADLLRAEGINPALHRVLIEQVLRTSARREMLGFEEKLEEVIAGALRSAQSQAQLQAQSSGNDQNDQKVKLLSNIDYEIAAFILVRVTLAVAHSVVVDRPKLNTPTLVDELTRLVVGYVGYPVPQRGR